jgi:tRNA-dihydrouridine synthase
MVNLGFWGNLKLSTDGPILCLAPMADVTDSAFRYVIAKYSKGMLGSISDITPHKKIQGSPLSLSDFVIWTEFVSADGLTLAPDPPATLSLAGRAGGRRRLMKGLEYNEIERPIVAQFFTSRPENMEKVSRLALELGFDGVDINMGCPDKSVERQGAGAGLIKDPSLARELILAAKEGATLRHAQGNRHLPVSVKTRLGYNKDELEMLAQPNDNLGGWLTNLLEAEPAVITIHARTRKEMSKVPAKWDRIKRAVEIRDEYAEGLKYSSKSTDISVSLPATNQAEGSRGPDGAPKTLIFGNGDVRDVAHAYQLAHETGCDGVMLGRAIFGDPFLFADSSRTVDIKKRLEVLVEHTKLFEQNFSAVKSFSVMKKHFKAYLNKAFEGSDTHILHTKNELLKSLMDTKNSKEVEGLVNNFISTSHII